MECKYDACVYGDAKVFGELIDTLWNVNKPTAPECFRRKRELIDTLWNVNEQQTTISTPHTSELIDTLWNVNARLSGHTTRRNQN